MELKDYKIKNTTKCGCGYEFTIRDMKKLQRLSEPIYGGAVRHVDEIECPQCQRTTLLLIKQQGQTYIVKDIAQKEDVSTEGATIDNEEPNTNSNELICPECKRSFKSKSGLAVHMKSHENK